MLAVAIPAWIVPGVLDWWCHRRTRIEEPDNGSVVESLVHSAMFAEAGIPLALGVFFEINPLVVTLMTSAAVAHEATAALDVKLAKESERHLSQFEQHVHSFLEVMPFAVAALMVLLHEPTAPQWRLRRRPPALRPSDLGLIGAVVAVFGVLPYTEELVRCLRTAARRPAEATVEAEKPAGSAAPAAPASPHHDGAAVVAIS